MSSDVHAKCTNSRRVRQAGTESRRALTKYSTAFTSWLVSRSMRLTSAASASVSSAASASSTVRAAAGKPRSSTMPGSATSALSQSASTRTRWRMSPRSLKQGPQLGCLVGIAAVDRGDGVERAVVHGREAVGGSYNSREFIALLHRGTGGERGFPERARQPGRAAGPGRRAVGRADPARGRELSDQRAAHAAGVHPCARPDQVGGRDHRISTSTPSTPSAPRPSRRPRSKSPTAGTTRSSRSTCSRPAPAPAAT